MEENLGHILCFRLVGKGWAGIRHEKHASGARFFCVCVVGCRMGCAEATEGGGVSTYIQCNNQKKNEPFVGMGRHTHPLVVVARAFSSPPSLPFVSLHLGVVLVPTRPPLRVVVSWDCVVVSGTSCGHGGGWWPQRLNVVNGWW